MDTPLGQALASCSTSAQWSTLDAVLRKVRSKVQCLPRPPKNQKKGFNEGSMGHSFGFFEDSSGTDAGRVLLGAAAQHTFR